MTSHLRHDARKIWDAGVAAVDSARLVREAVQVTTDSLQVAGQRWAWTDIDRILVIGGGKAGAGMAAGLEQALGADRVAEKVAGWVNVPADCVRTLQAVHLHAGRPAGQNEPTAEGVAGTEQMLRMVGTLTPRDLCIVLLSGGGSALLPAPVAGVSLADKQLVTRALMQSGATIAELNAVRSCLSRIKAGGLLRSMPAGQVVTLIISDVIDDPLPVIASGPTVDCRPDPQAALQILLHKLGADRIPPSVWAQLQAQVEAGRSVDSPSSTTDLSNSQTKGAVCRNVIIGNNLTAVRSAARQARALGYTVISEATNVAGIAREVGVELATTAANLQQSPPSRGRMCLISGGEPIVQMVATDQPRKGGRNQELVLAAAERLWSADNSGVVILSGGTDGEDGPTDAAGALFDNQVWQRAQQLGLRPSPFLAINNSYPFFDGTDGLLLTGPTHTNVMDLRVVLILPHS